MNDGTDETFPFASADVNLIERPPTAEQKIWLATRVANGIESAASLAKRLKYSRVTLKQSAWRLKNGSLLTGKRGRPYVIDTDGARSAKEVMVNTADIGDGMLRLVLNNEFHNSCSRRWPDQFAEQEEQDVVPNLCRRTVDRYVKRLRLGEYP
jgi:hypothetical protein